jgi:HPt (histidine-containing phosphotransfer) domain-containing protein
VPDLSDHQRQQLEALRRAYEAELPEKVTSVARAAAAAGLRNWDPADVRDLHHLVHRLAGSSALWGFTAVSKAAGELEEVVLAAMEGTPRPPAALSEHVRRLLEELQHAVPVSLPPGPPAAAPERSGS